MKRYFSVFLTLALTLALQAQQLPNFGFDTWSKSGGAWNLYAKNAPEGQRVWDTANHGLSILGINGTVPEYEHVASAGEGKAAVKMVSRKAFGKFVAGNLYTGRFVRVVKLSGAEMLYGVPFQGRPKSLSGYIHYIPAVVDQAKEPCLDRKGKMDIARIEVVLTDWTAPYDFTSNDGNFMDNATDPSVIGRGYLDISEDTGGYIPVEIPIRYRSDRKPTYVHITLTSSRDGGYFTGGTGSTLYADEFRFNY